MKEQLFDKASEYAGKQFNPETHKENQPNFYCSDLQEAFTAGYEQSEDEYKEKLRWIPVEEKLPDNISLILVCDSLESPIRTTALYQYGVFYPDYLLGHDDVKFWRAIL